MAVEGAKADVDQVESKSLDYYKNECAMMMGLPTGAPDANDHGRRRRLASTIEPKEDVSEAEQAAENEISSIIAQAQAAAQSAAQSAEEAAQLAQAKVDDAVAQVVADAQAAAQAAAAKAQELEQQVEAYAQQVAAAAQQAAAQAQAEIEILIAEAQALASEAVAEAEAAAAALNAAAKEVFNELVELAETGTEQTIAEFCHCIDQAQGDYWQLQVDQCLIGDVKQAGSNHSSSSSSSSLVLITSLSFIAVFALLLLYRAVSHMFGAVHRKGYAKVDDVEDDNQSRGFIQVSDVTKYTTA
jgi:chemotaxis protein histidine kinase CheA